MRCHQKNEQVDIVFDNDSSYQQGLSLDVWRVGLLEVQCVLLEKFQCVVLLEPQSDVLLELLVQCVVILCLQHHANHNLWSVEVILPAVTSHSRD